MTSKEILKLLRPKSALLQLLQVQLNRAFDIYFACIFQFKSKVNLTRRKHYLRDLLCVTYQVQGCYETISVYNLNCSCVLILYLSHIQKVCKIGLCDY